MTLQDLQKVSQSRKLTMLTAYDYPTAKILSRAGIDILLVGDSLGMVVLGYKDTKSVTLQDCIRHTAAVVRGNEGSIVVADMPLHTTDTVGTAVRNCHAVLQQTGADAVKIEGDARIVESLVKAGIPVMGHTGLKPQTAEKYAVTGKKDEEAKKIFDEAVQLEKAGAFAVVLECVPADLASRITKKLKVPTIGIGAGNGCGGQVLVISDMIGLYGEIRPKFVRKYADVSTVISDAVKQFKTDVENGNFPSKEESY
jgi:3-methyl-2-oxobutanoate hydroxymethyltransferase